MLKAALRIARPISAYFVIHARRGAMTRIGENHGLDAAVCPLDSQHGDIIVHQASWVDAQNDTGGCKLAAIDGEMGFASAEGKLHRLQIR